MPALETQPVRPAMKRNLNLDCLRAIAVFLVICRHNQYLPGSSHGWVGVDLFFVLSGYLISGLLFQQWSRTGSLQIPRFFVRRGLKIYPAFYVLIAVTLACSRWLPKAALHQYLSEVFFLQGYLQPVWTHTWSLSVEEHFYLFLPVALWLMQRLDRSSDPFRHLVKVFAVAAVACPVMRAILTHSRPWWDLAPTFRSHLRIDALLFGVLLCYFRRFRPETFQRLARSKAGLAVMALAAVMLFVFPKEQAIMKTVGLTVLYLGFGFLLIRTVDATPPRRLQPAVRVLAKIGFYSYSIYLWHMFVRWALLRWVHMPAGFVFFAINVAAAILWGMAASKLIEIPVLAYRDRYFPDTAVAKTPGSGELRAAAAAASH